MKTITIILILLISMPLFSNNDNWDNDFYLKNLSTDHDAILCTGDTTDPLGCINTSNTPLKFSNIAKAKFKQLMTDYGLAISPGFISPAETLGSKGFELGVNYSFAKIGQTNVNGETPWEGTYGGSNPGSLNLVTIEARKGLPASLEVGGRISYIFGSHLFVFGVSGKIALIESVGYAPDLAIRGTYSTMMGSKEVSMDVFTIDAILGYDFSLAGMMAIYPYVAYSLTKITADSNNILINSTGAPFTCNPNSDYCDYENDENYENRIDKFEEFNKTAHRFVVGVRFHNAAFVFTPEIMFSSESVWGINTKIGFDF